MKANHSGFPFLGQKLALSRWKPLALSTKLLMSLVWIGNYCRANGDWLLLFSFPFFSRPVLCVRACVWEGAGLAPRCSILPPPLNTVGRRRRRRASCYLQSPFAVSLSLPRWTLLFERLKAETKQKSQSENYKVSTDSTPLFLSLRLLSNINKDLLDIWPLYGPSTTSSFSFSVHHDSFQNPSDRRGRLSRTRLKMLSDSIRQNVMAPWIKVRFISVWMSLTGQTLSKQQVGVEYRATK